MGIECTDIDATPSWFDTLTMRATGISLRTSW